MKNKILIISDIFPCKNQTGGIMTANLIRFLLEEKIDVHFFCVYNNELNFEPDEDIENFITYYKYEKPSEDPNYSEDEYNKKINKICGSLDKLITNEHFDNILGILQGRVITELMHFLYKKKKIAYSVQLWDSLEWWLNAFNYPKERIESSMKIFNEVVSNAKTCLTASKNMSEIYSQKYHIPCFEIMLPVVKNEYVPSEHEEIIISMAGQIYAREELDAFLSALDNMNWKYDNKKIIFNYFGNYVPGSIDFEKHCKYRSNIKLNGFLIKNELLKKLASSDYLYCPYSFEKVGYKYTVAYQSFPSKVAMYVSLNIPILLHSPEYASANKLFKEYGAGLMIENTDVKEIEKSLRIAFAHKNNDFNYNKMFDDNFSLKAVKNKFLTGLNIKYNENDFGIRILEVNNTDLSGKRFNGYDLSYMINRETNSICKQIVTHKKSQSPYVISLFEDQKELEFFYKLHSVENEIMGVHSQISLTSNLLKNNIAFQSADLVHYHLIDNAKLSLSQMVELCELKPTVLTLHDPWFFTGHCVYPQECEKWKNGCKQCPHLERLFEIKEDNSHFLWELKKKIFGQLDIDIIVSTPFMVDMLEKSPITDFKNIHVLPFGIDLNQFKYSISQKEARKRLGIPKDDIVIFLRAQKAMKGTEYVEEALKLLITDASITILTCDTIGLLDSVKDKFNVMDLGNIGDDKMALAYNSCDMFLMPSKGETFGVMAIEAMASSKPVIVFDNTALPYVTAAPEIGVLVENLNSQKLMEAIKWLIDNPDECKKRGKLGRKYAEEHYDIERYNREILAIYKSAYERQKNKKILCSDHTIIEKSLDTELLKIKLESIYKKMFPGEILDQMFICLDGSLKYETKRKIDYSLPSVQNLLYNYNDYIYNKLYCKPDNYQPLISVVIPVYNGERYLSAAIESVLNQTYKNFELIIVDDGSTDKTKEIALSYRDKIRYYYKKNGGVASALNYGISLMKGDYFSWLSHDDTYKPEKLSTQVEFLKKLKDRDVILCSNFDLIDEDNNYISTTNYHNKYLQSNLDRGIYPVLNGLVNGCTILIPKCVFKTDLFNESLLTSNDYEMWSRIFMKYNHYYMTDSLVNYRLHEAQGTNTIKTYKKEADIFWSKFISSLDEKIIKSIGVNEFGLFYNLYIQKKDAGLKKSEKICLNLAEKYFYQEAPFVSIIMPAYNSSQYIGLAIESVLNQSYGDFELILIDDCSSDDTLKIMQDYAQKDFRICVLKNEKNLGVAKSLNKGLKKARGKYFTRLDSDDTCTTDRLYKQIEALSDNNISFCATNISFIDKNNNLIQTNCYKKPICDISFALCFTNPIPNATIMYDMSIVKKHNLEFANYKAAEDYDFLINYCEYGKGIFIEESLYNYRILDDSLFHKNTDYALTKSLEIASKYYKKICGNEAPSYLAYLTDFYPVLNEVDLPTLYLIYKLIDKTIESFEDYYHYGPMEKFYCMNYLLGKIGDIHKAINSHDIVTEPVVISSKKDSYVKNSYHRLKYYYKKYGFVRTLRKIGGKVLRKLRIKK